MSMKVLNEGSVVLRLEFSIADAVRERGLLKVMGAAIRAWWAQRPINYSAVPAYLREDVGLPAAEDVRSLAYGNPFAAPKHPPNRSQW